MPWKVFVMEFQKRTDLAYDKNKLKNKWDGIRSRWSLWKALKGKETGLGWDREKGTISASKEWWQMKIEVIIDTNAKVMELMNLESSLHDTSSQILADSLVKLVSLDGLVPDSPEFSFACTLIEDPQKRIILDRVPYDHTGLQWINFLYAKSEKN
ncbi:L10-interacting MYB domain-containing protein [Bienertia sinuspersici]